ncbi:chemotaxis protein CheA [Planctomicrobium sp. SH668]|uniref:chemotaxis protein CheA n=1 Tax=Planctomicrobium sp. SH668 TaxID=3448126 RepID=UPI003F5B1AFE
MEQIDDIVKEFLVECYENLDRLDRDLIELETSPTDRERLSSVFRTIHTIKGTSGFLAYPKLEHIAHVGENLLVLLRDGQIHLNRSIANGLLAMVDAIRNILECIEENGTEGEATYDSVISILEQLLIPGVTANAPNSSHTDSESKVGIPHEDVLEIKTTIPSILDNTESSFATDADKPEVSVPMAHREVAATRPEQHADADIDLHDRSVSISDTTIRIDVMLLDRLMNLVGELVLARNQVLQFSRSTEDSAIVTASQRLNQITTELQAGVMKTRMQPISNAWSKLPRIVRDLAAQCGKRVQIKMEGADTELDKTILEAIKDPLTHIVRNSVDHGIETPEVRVSKGKPAEGTLQLRAFHEGGQVNIEITDDGGGIDIDRVRNKAITKGILKPEQAASMSDRELTQLILQPGFSTAEKVTNVSGRGVGMDVVKTNVEKIGGTLDICSVHHQGTTLRIKIPLTLAIVPALIVDCWGERFAIPQVSLLELVRLEGDRAKRDIELIHDSPVYRLRGKLLPIVYLDEQLKLRSRRTVDEIRSSETANIIVLQAEDHQFGLIVDHIRDTQEIVVKPLGPHLKSVPAYAGATIMGDGAISLILDVLGLAQHANILTADRDVILGDHGQNADRRREEIRSWLVVDPGDGTRAAIPLASVSRLEEIDVSSIEFDGRQEVVQYRSRIMPLVKLIQPHERLGQSNSKKLPVVVFSDESRSIGLVVRRVVDIIESSVDEEFSTTHVIAGRVTRMINPGSFLSGPHHPEMASSSHSRSR